MRLLLAVAFALSAGAQDVTCDVGDCALTCNDRGKCCKGDATYEVNVVNPDGTPLEILQTTNHNGESCECDEGWTGVKCDHSVVFCDGDINPCFHNGTCVNGIEDVTGKKVHVCDCSSAFDDQDTYIGLYCEQAAPTKEDDNTVFCNDDGTGFCMNGGECGVSDNDDVLHSGCICSNEFTGFHCEIHYVPSQSCTRECLNEGDCAYGSNTALINDPELEDSGTPDPSVFEHCRCARGFSGPNCEIPYESCQLNEGDKPVRCYNGGFCISSTDASFDVGCDCSTAKNQTHSFAGLYCQTPSTEFCLPPLNGEAQHYCVNNGTCVVKEFEISECNCPSKFTGDHCEYKIGDEDVPIELVTCITICDNDGVCREGSKDFGIVGDFNSVDHMFNETSNDDFEYCSCPEGYTGLHCEIVVELCENGTHVCLHGGQCVLDSEDWKCDCDASDSMAAGPLCQHLATDICMGQAGATPFCVNGGNCQDDGACACPDGYFGDQCEFEEQYDDDQFLTVEEVLPDDYQTTSNGSVIVASAIVAVVAIVIILVAVLITTLNRVERPAEMANAPPPTAFVHPVTSVVATDPQPEEAPDNEEKPEII